MPISKANKPKPKAIRATRVERAKVEINLSNRTIEMGTKGLHMRPGGLGFRERVYINQNIPERSVNKFVSRASLLSKGFPFSIILCTISFVGDLLYNSLHPSLVAPIRIVEKFEFCHII